MGTIIMTHIHCTAVMGLGLSSFHVSASTFNLTAFTDVDVIIPVLSKGSTRGLNDSPKTTQPEVAVMIPTQAQGYRTGVLTTAQHGPPKEGLLPTWASVDSGASVASPKPHGSINSLQKRVPLCLCRN